MYGAWNVSICTRNRTLVLWCDGWLANTLSESPHLNEPYYSIRLNEKKPLAANENGDVENASFAFRCSSRAFDVSRVSRVIRLTNRAIQLLLLFFAVIVEFERLLFYFNIISITHTRFHFKTIFK